MKLTDLILQSLRYGDQTVTQIHRDVLKQKNCCRHTIVNSLVQMQRQGLVTSKSGRYRPYSGFRRSPRWSLTS